MRLIMLLSLPFMLAACVVDTPATPDEADACKAGIYQGLIGQPKQVLDQMQFPARTRIIGPNDPVTMDYSPARLNVEIGDNDRIAKIACY